jgi:predicted DNA-binding protein (MmcQ/YjbR family)
MDIEELRDYALAKQNVEEGFPFGEGTLVFKVNGKIFLLVSLNAVPLQFNAKCDPEKAIDWREEYPCVQPGYHMNKKHWNTVMIDGCLQNRQLKEMVDDSYKLVAKRNNERLG